MITRPAESSDIQQIVSITNEAFMVDAYFKKPDCLDRTSSEQVERILASENETFIVAFDGKILGSVYVHWDKENLKGSFGMLSVSSNARKRGIGSLLVSAAESFCFEKLGPFTMNIPVIHSRIDLPPFYEKRGYKHFKTIPFVDPHLVKEGEKMFLKLFEKVITNAMA